MDGSVCGIFRQSYPPPPLFFYTESGITQIYASAPVPPRSTNTSNFPVMLFFGSAMLFVLTGIGHSL